MHFILIKLEPDPLCLCLHLLRYCWFFMDGSSLQCASLHTQGAFLSGGILTYGKMEGCEERSVLGSNRLKVLNLGSALAYVATA